MTSLARANRIITMCARLIRLKKPRVYVYLSISGIEMIQWGMPGEVRFG